MYNGKKIIVFIPARFGSQGIPQKNLKLIGGEPLFMHSVKYAFSSKYVDDVLVSSDSRKILDIAHANGCIQNSLRPAELASNTARNIDAMLWELKECPKKYDAVIQLQPTYPLRPEGELDRMIEKYFETETSLMTVYKVNDRPEFLRRIGDDGKLYKIMASTSEVRRQNFTQYYKLAGSVHINNVHTLDTNVILNEAEIPYIIDEYYTLDIDTPKDWEELEKRFATK